LPGISGPIMQQPETYLGMLGDAFDEKGDLTKDSLRDFLKQYLAAFESWIGRIAK
jgi:chromate reductase